MNKNKKRVFLSISGVILLLILFSYFRIRANANDPVRNARPTPAVEVSTVQRGAISKTISFTGNIDAYQEASIFPKVNGNLEEEFVNIGDYVQRGQLLALIDTTIYSQNVGQARGTYMQAEATLTNAKITYERNRTLLDQNLIAKQDLDNSETAYKVAQAQIEATEATYKNAVTQLSYCKIVAPFSGYITRRYFDPGVYVTASTNAQGSTLFTLAEIQKVKIMVNVLESDVQYLRNVSSADVMVGAYPNQVFKGKITRISQQFDLATRTMPVEVDLDNAQHFLKPGMFAAINLVLSQRNDALILPTQDILKDDSGSYVYTLSKDSTVRKAYVQIGISQDNRNEILSGITNSDRILTVGQDLVNNGMKVRVAK
ncbi:MAG TPA: efflux RND transporter periplasmic adaptor subunit [Candidatus Acidoferrales bacterium]|nr:efflux RND transporter periplasmic adaptor subunit [Candidatus Acidoferrales bacterium]